MSILGIRHRQLNKCRLIDIDLGPYVKKVLIDHQGLCLLSRSIVGVDDLATTDQEGRVENYYYISISIRIKRRYRT